MDRSFITDRDMNSYRAILGATHGYLEGNDPSGVIKTTRGAKYKDIISKLFPTGRVTTPWLSEYFEAKVDHI